MNANILFFVTLSVANFSLTKHVRAEAVEPKVIIRLDLLSSALTIQSIPGTIDIAGQDLKNQTIDLVGSRDYFELLKEGGFDVEIIDEQRGRVDGRYLHSKKVRSLIYSFKEKYPDLVHIEEIGKSLLGQPILAVRLSTPENILSKPTILFNGMHHAREVMTAEVTMDIISYLLTHSTDPEMPWIAEWLKNTAIWVLPQFNPDGNDIVWATDNWWRKNARGDDRQIWGVDLNRNYPYEWASCGGSSESRNNQTFHGESAGSEPETQAMMTFVKNNNFAMNISYHSYSELVIAPYGCDNHFTPENAIVKKIGYDLARRLKTDDGFDTYRYGTGWEILYPVDGDDISWMYNEVNTLAYVVEVNASAQGFQPDYGQWRDRTVEAQRPGWMGLINRLVTGPQIRGRMLDSQTGAPVDGFIKIAGLNYSDEKPRSARNGFFYKPLIAGHFELEFSAPGYKTETMAFSLDDESTVIQDIYFEPEF